MKNYNFLLSLSFLLSACQPTPTRPSGDEAIRRVDNCVCYKSAEGQQLKPWELAWEDPEKLRNQFSHCICEAHIDLQSVKNPRRYVVPGTTVK